MGLDQNLYRIRGDEKEEIAYFRKVNFLHDWIERNVWKRDDDINCEDVPLNLEQLAGLLQACERVVAKPDLGPTELPTASGFFFGSVDYDEFYVQDVKEVQQAVQSIIDYEVLLAREGKPPSQIIYWSWF